MVKPKGRNPPGRGDISAAARAVAGWMLAELKRRDTLYQEDAVDQIAREFGDEFTYENENGNAAIRRDVLAAFRELTESDVVWDRSERAWRWREKYDEPGRRQTE